MTNIEWKQFWGWANVQREGAGLSWREVEARAGVGNATLTNRARDYLRPTLGNMQAIAEVLKIPLPEVMRQAGLFDDPNEREITLQQLMEFAQALPVEERKRVLGLMRAMYPVAGSAAELR